MQERSPIIFWLLLAATICIDIVAFNWAVTVNSADANTALQALLSGEVSLVCIWSGLSLEKQIWTRIGVWFAVVAAEATRIAEDLWIDDFNILAGSSVWVASRLSQRILQAVLLLFALWVLERTSFWRRQTRATTKWRFSLGQLVMVTTVVAVLAACVHVQYEFVMRRIWDELPFVVATAVLGLASAIIWRLSWHWMLRLASVVAIAILLGGAVGYCCQVSVQTHIAYYIVQALVISLWLGLAPILPASPTAADAT